MDAVQQANSGHPGLPMGMAPAAYLLFAEVMKHDPKDPEWPDRDRFVLSAGHGSMLLYAALHLAGYDLPLDELKSFRQWGSLTPGHPERDRVHVTPGVEVTTGPLGQGFANGVGMAIAERFLRERYGAEVQDHHVYAIVSDGDLMEGVASEAASLAGQLGLGRLDLPLRRQRRHARRPRVAELHRRGPRQALRGLRLADAHASRTPTTSTRCARRSRPARPTRSARRSSASSRSSATRRPQQGTSEVHGKALGEDERARVEGGAWAGTPTRRSSSPTASTRRSSPSARRARARGVERALRALPRRAARTSPPSGTRRGRAGRWRRCREVLPTLEAGRRRSRRAAPAARSWPRSSSASRRWSAAPPTCPSRRRPSSRSPSRTRPSGPDRNVFFGVREHGMGGAVNGMAAHGGIVRPYGSTFLQFADYMRGSIRLSALTGLAVAWVFTHDSVALGEDGPTHQPVEHHMALRAIPGPRVPAPGRRERDRRGVARDPRGPRGPGGDGAVAAEPAGPRPLEGRGRRRAGRLRARARRRPDDRRHRLRGVGRGRGGAEARRRRARRVDAELGALRAAGRGVPRVGAGRPRADGLGRGRHLAGLGPLRRARTSRSTASARARPGTEVLEQLGINVDNVVDVVCASSASARAAAGAPSPAARR